MTLEQSGFVGIEKDNFEKRIEEKFERQLREQSGFVGIEKENFVKKKIEQELSESLPTPQPMNRTPGSESRNHGCVLDFGRTGLGALPKTTG